MKTEILAVMFTDIAGYTKRTSGQTYEENAHLLEEHALVVHHIVRRFGGRVVKEIGDGMLATFASPTRAVAAAMAIQDRLAEANRDRVPADQLHLRIAINVGEVRVERHDVFGNSVNVAARIEAKTPVDEIYISSSTYLTMNRSGLRFASLDEHHLKGIAEPVALYSLPRFAPNEETTVMTKTPLSALPYGGRQLTTLAAQRRRQVVRWGALATLLAAAIGSTGSIAYQRLRRDSLTAELDREVAAAAWQEAAQTLAVMQEAGIAIGAPVDQVMIALSDPGRASRACRALDFFEEIIVTDTGRREKMAVLRLQHAFNLLRLGELAQADVCLNRVSVPTTSPERRLLELAFIHRDALSALGSHHVKGLWSALKRYEIFLRAGGAPDEQLKLISEVAVGAYRYSRTKPLADSLVSEFLQASAVPLLVNRVVSGSGPDAARSCLVARLDRTAAIVAAPAKQPAWLGVKHQTIDVPLPKRLKQSGDTLVVDVVEGGPAAKAGVKAGDVIFAFDGRPVDKAEDLDSQVRKTVAGQKVVLALIRGEARKSITIRTEPRP